jgi:hypothetical protein
MKTFYTGLQSIYVNKFFVHFFSELLIMLVASPNYFNTVKHER